MKRSQINYAIDKALAMAETFRTWPAGICPLYGSHAGRKNGMKVGMKSRIYSFDRDATDFASGCFRETGLTLLTLRNGSLSDPRYTKPYAEKMLQIQQESANPLAFPLPQNGGHH